MGVKAMSKLTRGQIENRFGWISTQLSSDQSTQDRLNELKVLALSHLSRQSEWRPTAPTFAAGLTRIEECAIYQNHISNLNRFIDKLLAPPPPKQEGTK
jgi:hypothetical protein